MRGSRAATVVAERLNAQRHFANTGDESQLRKLKRTKVLDASGREVPFLTDPDDWSASAISGCCPSKASTRGVGDAQARPGRRMTRIASAATRRSRCRVRVRRIPVVALIVGRTPPRCYRASASRNVASPTRTTTSSESATAT